MDENFEVSRLFQSYFLAIHFGKTRVPITRKGYNLYSTLNSHFKDVMESEETIKLISPFGIDSAR